MAATAMMRAPAEGRTSPNGAPCRLPGARRTSNATPSPSRSAPVRASARRSGPQQGVRIPGRIQRLAQTAAGQHGRTVYLLVAREQQVDIARELQVLKPIVEHVDIAPEPPLRQPAAEVAIRRDDDDDAGQVAGEHQGLVAGGGELGAHASAIAHDQGAVGHVLPAVASREHRGTTSRSVQHAREQLDDRRLAAAAHREVADADHRPGQTPAALRPGRVEPAAGTGQMGVEEAQQITSAAPRSPLMNDAERVDRGGTSGGDEPPNRVHRAVLRAAVRLDESLRGGTQPCAAHRIHQE